MYFWGWNLFWSHSHKGQIFYENQKVCDGKREKMEMQSLFRQVLGVFSFSYLIILISRSINVIYGIQVINFPMSLSCFGLSCVGFSLGLDSSKLLIQPHSNHFKGTWSNTHMCSHTFITQMFSCLRSSRGTAHSLLSFSPLHQRLIILSHGMGAVNGDTHYKAGVKDGWRSLHSLFI